MNIIQQKIIAEILRQKHPIQGVEISDLIDISSNILYPELRSLERKGWVQGYWDEKISDSSRKNGVKRKFYAVTEEGVLKVKLCEWFQWKQKGWGDAQFPPAGKIFRLPFIRFIRALCFSVESVAWLNFCDFPPTEFDEWVIQGILMGEL